MNLFNKIKLKLKHIIFLLLCLEIVNIILPISQKNWNQQEIKKLAKQKQNSQFAFAVMGDNKYNIQSFKKILKDIDQHHFNFSINNGDIVWLGLKPQFRYYFKMLKNITTPHLVTIGNHELDLNKNASNYQSSFGPLNYSFSYANSLFISLNDASYSISDSQFAWLEDELKKNYQHKFVFFHIPLFDPRPQRNFCLQHKQTIRKLMDLFKKYQPDIVFNCHIHNFYDFKKEGVHFIITGGAGAPSLKGDYQNHPFFNHYLAIKVNGSQVSYQRIPFPTLNLSNKAFRYFFDTALVIKYLSFTHPFLIIALILSFIPCIKKN